MASQLLLPIFSLLPYGATALLFLLLLYLKLSKKKSKRVAPKIPPLPPGPPRWPIFGNLLQLGPLPHKAFAAFSARYGPLVYLRLGSVDAITTDDPQVIKEILLRQDEVFASRPRTVAAVHLAYGCGDVALAPLGPRWRRMRRICVEHLLTAKRLEWFSRQRAEEARQLVGHVMERSKAREAVNVREALAAFSMNNVTTMLLGKRFFFESGDEAREFMGITHELFHLLGLIYLGDYVPAWRWFDPYGCERKMRVVGRRVDEFHTRLLEEHRRRRKGKKEEEMDFVDVLLSLRGEDGKDPLDDVEIKSLIQDVIAAATDTSSVTSEWAVTEVIKHPHVLHKIQEELDVVVGTSRMVSESDLRHLNYLRCVVRETFRLHPAGPFLIPHESIRSTTLKGCHVPAGTRVFINTYALGRNPHVWGDNVDAFRPERHAAEGVRVDVSHGLDFKILPFGAGRRKCPGATLGLTFVLMALATLFHSFYWSPPPGVVLDDLDTTEVYGLTMPRREDLWAVATPRLPEHLYSRHL